jgi:hypothetical protein
MANEQKITGKMEVAGVVGPLWFAAWLFTIGYVQLGLGKAILAAALWPYYLGSFLAASGGGS